MTKKKPAKKKVKSADVAIRDARREIVNNLYVEVERVNGERMAALQARVDSLSSEHAETVRECGEIIDRLLAVEAKVMKSRSGLIRRFFRG